MNNIQSIQDMSDAESQRLMDLFADGIAAAMTRFKNETGIHISGSCTGVNLYSDARQIVLNYRT